MGHSLHFSAWFCPCCRAVETDSHSVSGSQQLSSDSSVLLMSSFAGLLPLFFVSTGLLSIVLCFYWFALHCSLFLLVCSPLFFVSTGLLSIVLCFYWFALSIVLCFYWFALYCSLFLLVFSLLFFVSTGLLSIVLCFYWFALYCSLFLLVCSLLFFFSTVCVYSLTWWLRRPPREFNIRVRFLLAGVGFVCFFFLVESYQ